VKIPLLKREYILFRNVEHCRNQFRPGISSVQFRELDRHWTQEPHSTLIEFRQFPELHGIPGNSYQFRNSGNSIQLRNRTETYGIPANSDQFRNCTEFLGIPTDSGIAGIQSSSGIPDRNYISPSPSSIPMCLQFNRFDQHLIPVRNSGNWIETELHGIPGNSYRFRNSGNSVQLRNCMESTELD
jgi:hypothetical protein